MDIVSQEMIGAIPCATLDATLERAAVGQQVTIPLSQPAVATDITPAVTPPDDGEQTFDNTQMTITKSRRVPFRWTGEQERALANGGVSADVLRNSQIVQALRTLVNEIEVDVYQAARKVASRAYGTAGTTPFASGVGDSAQLRKLLDDNGAPQTDRAVIIDTAAGANLRTNMQLTKVNEAGTSLTLRSGELINLHGQSFHESFAAGTPVTPGTGAGYTTNTAGYAVGATSIALITGSGTINAGDVITFAGDSNKYVVETGITGPGTIKIGGPGLRKAIPASATAVTVGSAFTAGIVMPRSNLLLATRAPALPDGGDSAVDRTTIVDPRSGIAFEIAMYAQYRQMQYEVSASWGVKALKSAHAALLLG
jgi:hypothetical protein